VPPPRRRYPSFYNDSASGAAVIKYEGRRGVVWRIKYADATGAQQMETLGREPVWNRERAERELGKRLERVDKATAARTGSYLPTSPTRSNASTCQAAT
jgi:hypothetical protein